MEEENRPIRVAQIMGKMVGGGVEAFVMNYYRNIDKSKIQFDFIVDEDSTDIPKEEIESLGGRVIVIPPYQHIFKYVRKLTKVLRENKYKIVHSQLNTLSIFPLYCAYRAKVHIRIAHSHSTTNKIEWKKNLVKNLLKPFAKIFATDYWACSEHAGRWLFGNKEFDKGNVYIVNNAIDIEKFKYNKEVREVKRKELNINNDTLVIGNIGRFVKQKNQEFLVDIFNEVYKKNANSILLLVGQGPLQDTIKEKVKVYGLEKNVKFLGQRTDINYLYQVFDIFVLPSIYEGLGIVLIEAQVSGLYCIASSQVPRVSKVTDNIEFLDLENNPDQWAQEILKKSLILKRENHINDVAQSGYDIKNQCKKLEDKYIELVGKI